MAVFSFLHPGRCTYVYMLRARLYYDTYTPLLRHIAPLHRPVYMYVHVRDQNDNATCASTRWVPTVRHFLACEGVAGGSQQSGGRIIFFARTHFLACEDVAGGSQQSGGNHFFCPHALPCVRRCSWWVPAVRGRIVFFQTHFLACEGVAGGSQQSGGKCFFHKIRWPVR